MKNPVILPLALLASITTLASCTQREIVPAPVAPTQNNASAPTTGSSASGTENVPSATITRTQVVQYQSPAGTDDVEFSVTVENGIITAVSSRTLATNDGSKYNQDKFASEVAGKVVGKSVKDFDLDVVGGASLTTAAFEQFVQSL